MTNLSAAAEALLGGTVDQFGRTADGNTVTRPTDDFLYVDAASRPVWVTVRLYEGQSLTVCKVDCGRWPVHLVRDNRGLFTAWAEVDEQDSAGPVLTLLEPGAAVWLLDGDDRYVYYQETTAP